MRDKDLYAPILGVRAPWSVRDVELRPAVQEVEVFIEHAGSVGLSCPQCGQACGRHDTRRRSWRHLDICQFRTTLTAEVPRVQCPEHGVLQLAVPWAERGSRFATLLESLAIDWLREANLTAVSRRLRASWDELDGIQQRAVRRGLARRSTTCASASSAASGPATKRSAAGPSDSARPSHGTCGDPDSNQPVAGTWMRWS